MEPPQNFPLQRTSADAFRNNSSSTFNGAGISNPNGTFVVGGDMNILSNAAPQPTDPEKEKQEKRQKLLESLRFDQIDARQDSIENSHAKTCRWFLDTDVYKMWAETGSSHANNFLWIKGKPGAGKSTLMKFLYDQIRAQTHRKKCNDILISFFFNARGHGLEKSTLGLYRSLLWQLLDKRPDLQQVLDELRPGFHWTSESLKSRLDEAIQKLGGTPIFFLIDALDECDQDQIRDMVPFLEALVVEQSSLHVCFASRHYPHITVQTALDIILEERDGHEQDISTYLTSALRIKPNELAEQLRTEIQEKAHGVFIWVVLVVKILNKEYDAGRKYSLRERLQELPSDLHHLFRDILTRDSNNRAGLLLCIQWVLFAKEPLTPRQLHLAILSGTEPEFLPRCHSELILEDDVQKYILDNSKGLAESTRSEVPTVQFIHESVRDFLLKGKGLGELFNGPEPNIHGESHEALKNCCLTYLGMEPLVELDKYSCSEALQAFPFLEYAHSRVLHHADKAGQNGIGQEQFLSIFSRRQWVKQHNLLEKAGLRRYTPNASLLYILAESGLSELIRAHSCRQSCFEIEGERYRVPILAAQASSHEIAVQVMLELQAERIPGFDFADFCKRFKLAGRPKSLRLSRSYEFSQGRKLLEELIEYADNQVLLFFLETTGEYSQYTASTPDELFLLACAHQKFDSAKFLVQHCASRTNAGGVNTPLHHALAHRALEMIVFLAYRGIGLSATDKYGDTPIHIAIENDYFEVVQLLLQNGADPSVAGNNGNTPRHLEIAKLLLEYGADLSAANEDGNTPLHRAISKGDFEMARLFLDRGADFSAPSKYGNTPLHQAVYSGHFEMAKLLLDLGADISAAIDNGNTPLHQAAYSGHFEMAKLLLGYGANISATNKQGETPLHRACYNACGHNHTKIAGLLIDHGADPSATTGNGETPLHHLVDSHLFGYMKERLETAKLLVDSGVDVSAPDNNGRTPLHLTLNRGLTDISDFLQSCGSESSAADRRY
ncbi:hypothetical protein PFICI_13899 [Pestalotiopsis fici W106-1]|uniref:NACHT domain-containing protein n=1 Tax=Pestalotiopsis fici (strain W106-1 / CGMCC3.15140) TaxID=1229662 RepID=W3WJH8_PESFW|nr:uncharacterized protein PFICI_13899 [Pestalotiopsis fici W106-1]ETS74033.1 hypothetical protein PFICI_13899 [Pestalotiopsis fici W106-1]